jgi:ferredoxin--NADP+ reductase
MPGVHAVGWIKRGPTGILGTNKRDAAETVASLVEDLRAGRLNQPEIDGGVHDLLAGRDDIVTVAGWRQIDAAELSAGRAAGRPRAKLAEREALLKAATS